ncbi:MAG: hypothetical protein AVDCRST_MAG88-948, partial [uncultured Thermomicrobiales bacterium]
WMIGQASMAPTRATRSNCTSAS